MLVSFATRLNDRFDSNTQLDALAGIIRHSDLIMLTHVTIGDVVIFEHFLVAHLMTHATMLLVFSVTILSLSRLNLTVYCIVSYLMYWRVNSGVSTERTAGHHRVASIHGDRGNLQVLRDHQSHGSK